jgi:hypothetical protein
MTDREQAVIDAARSWRFAWDEMEATSIMGTVQKKMDRIRECERNLKIASITLDSEPDYRERMARLYRGEG